MATPQPFDPSALKRYAAALGWQAPAFHPLMPPKTRRVSRESTLSDDGIQARTEQLNRVATSCRRRIRELDDSARSEGSRVSAASEHTFWRFLGRSPFGAQPGLALLDNGNLRANWGDMQPTHVGLQFLPNDQIQYVVFARPPSAPDVMRGRGRAGIATIPKLLDSYGVADILDP